MSGIVGSRFNMRGSGLVGSLGTDGQVFTSSGAGAGAVFEAAAGGGKLLQVVSTAKTDTFSTDSSSFTDVTGLTVNITPAATSSKILIIVNLVGDNDSGYSYARLMRDSTEISIGDASNSNTRSSFGNFNVANNSVFLTGALTYLDSPSTTSATTYKIQAIVPSAGTFYINYGGATGTDSGNGRSVSTITVIEVGA